MKRQESEYVTKQEAAQLLGVSTKTIERLVNAGILKRYSPVIGRNRVLLKRSEVETLRDAPPTQEK